jgi:hypothetical protein
MIEDQPLGWSFFFDRRGATEDTEKRGFATDGHR